MGCLAALLLPLRELTVPLKKGRTEPLATHITGKSLKRSNDVVNAVALLHAELPTLAHLYTQVKGAASVRLEASAGSENSPRTDALLDQVAHNYKLTLWGNTQPFSMKFKCCRVPMRWLQHNCAGACRAVGERDSEARGHWRAACGAGPVPLPAERPCRHGNVPRACLALCPRPDC